MWKKVFSAWLGHHTVGSLLSENFLLSFICHQCVLWLLQKVHSYSCYFPDAWHCDKRNSTCPGSDTPFKNAYDSLIRLVDSLTKAQIIWMIKGKWFWIMITVKLFCNEMMVLAIILGLNVQSWAKGTFLGLRKSEQLWNEVFVMRNVVYDI